MGKRKTVIWADGLRMDVSRGDQVEVRDAYNSVKAYNSFTVEVRHKHLMKDMKVLVEAIANADGFNKADGAILLKSLLPIYAKASNPIE